MHNIVDITNRLWISQKSLDISLSREQRSATVHKLTSPSPVFHVHRERLTAQDVDAEEFFSILVSMWQVTIVSASEEMTLESRLRVEKGPDDICEMGINTFIRLTEPERGIVWKDDIDAYILPVLSGIGIRIGMIREGEDIFTQSDFKEEDLEVFHAENIDVIWEGGFYSCLIDNLDGDSVAFTLDDFISPDDIKLLHFLCHAYHGYFGNGCIVDEERLRVELSSNEDTYTDTRIIPIALLREIILRGIERKYPLYLNYSSDKRIKMFYDKMIYPLLSEEYLTGEFEEE